MSGRLSQAAYADEGGVSYWLPGRFSSLAATPEVPGAWEGGYTYFNPQTGHEFSAVAGFTYNFKNQDTQYQNGIDFHVDWVPPSFSRSRFSSALLDTCISR